MMIEPYNEPVLQYAPGSDERSAIIAEYERQSQLIVEVPCIINGEEVFTGNTMDQIVPHDHQHIIAKVHLAGPDELQRACDGAAAAQEEWIELGMEARADILDRAADILAGPQRMKLNAVTMLNQSKTAFQAEIDASCELIDFWRFNSYFARQFHDQLQPPISPPGINNSMEMRPVEGFILAIAPFNFTAIGGNLPTAPGVVGCTSLWKPSRNSVLSNYYVMQILMEAGLPPGVIQFVPSSGPMISEIALNHKSFGGVHFTGSTKTFQGLWSQVAEAIPRLGTYPIIVGETGGKDFVVAHHDCDRRRLIIALVLASFEYQGQKCSACSRAYIPESVWADIEEELLAEVAQITMGSAANISNFMTAVIDKRSFDNIKGYIDRANARDSCDILIGGGCDDSVGYFVEPTIIRTTDPKAECLVEEIFGPVLTVYIYPDDEFEEALEMCDSASDYALTGSIFSSSEENIALASKKLRFTAGNFYINDKPTGSVVGQQPFGGARASGTNDKAGSPLNLLRWLSPRTIKRTDSAPTEWKYPFMG
jgi:1-pyrroline-5-carboxylate dehydrogenase